MVWLFKKYILPLLYHSWGICWWKEVLYAKQSGWDSFSNKNSSDNSNTRPYPSELGKTLNTLLNLPEPSPFSSTYTNTLPVNQQIPPSVLIRLNQFPGRYRNKLVIPIKLFSINLLFMGVLALFHVNPVWDFCYPLCDFSSTFPINKG